MKGKLLLHLEKERSGEKKSGSWFFSDFMRQGMQGSRFMMLKVPRTSQCADPQACQPRAHGCALSNLPGASRAVTVSCSRGISASPTSGSEGEAGSSHWSALGPLLLLPEEDMGDRRILNTSANASSQIFHAFGPKSPHCCINFSPPPSLTTAYTRKEKKRAKERKE